jgi:hypothetical protein
MYRLPNYLPTILFCYHGVYLKLHRLLEVCHLPPLDTTIAFLGFVYHKPGLWSKC